MQWTLNLKEHRYQKATFFHKIKFFPVTSGISCLDAISQTHVNMNSKKLMSSNLRIQWKETKIDGPAEN